MRARRGRRARALRQVRPIDRLLLQLHGTVAEGSRAEAEEAWALVGDELIDAALARAGADLPVLPEAWWRLEPGLPEELRPMELPSGGTAIVGDVLARRAAWALRQHAEALGLKHDCEPPAVRPAAAPCRAGGPAPRWPGRP